MLEIEQIPILSDNYSYLITDQKTKTTACIDPSVSKPIIEVVEKKKIQLNFILNTHHHFDHVGGNIELKKKYGCKIVGNLNDKERIPGIDICLKDEEIFKLGNSECKVFDVSGHTVGHICYYFKKDNALFCGDTLFSLGCGRIFEGTPLQMSRSLLKIRSLPNQTKIFCGHEYTESNAKFAFHLEPDSFPLKEKIKDITKKRKANKPTVPSVLEDEKKLNPFLKFDNKQYLNKIGLESNAIEENFRIIRQMKDQF